MSLGGAAEPTRVAIVGAGPAGFYAAGQLLSEADRAVTVDLFDRLATPWGLVRYGVAPDHPKIKSVTRVFEKTAALPGFRFHGNVEIGADLTHEELAAAFDAVIYANGAAGDRRLGIPGEDLPGFYSATDFVAWYNGHPDFADREFPLDARRAVVIGNGNVALDVARMLALDPAELAATDTADHALEALAAAQIEEVVVLGRRGPVQAAYTTPELRELGEMVGAEVVVDPAEATPDPLSQALLDRGDVHPTARKNAEIVAEYATRPRRGARRRVVLRFLAAPIAVIGIDRVGALEVARTELVADDRGGLAARVTMDTEVIETQLVFRSIGYRSHPIPGVPFDDARGAINHAGGRVTEVGTGTPVPGLYSAGWVKRGPSGVIGTNKKCAQETVDALLADLDAGRLPRPTLDPAELRLRLEERGVTVVDYAGWQLIDAHERGLGEPLGRPRVKLVRRDDHLRHAAARAAGPTV